MKAILKYIKPYSLPISIALGVCSYFIYHSLPFGAEVRHATADAVSIIQPVLLFLMLFFSFCRVEPQQMKPRMWHLWLGL